jgi:hypothetical protein
MTDTAPRWRVRLLSCMDDGSETVDLGALVVTLNQWTYVPPGSSDLIHVKIMESNPRFLVEHYTGAVWKPVLHKHPEIANRIEAERLAARLSEEYGVPSRHPVESESRQEQAEKLARAGYTELQIAQHFNVTDRTVRRWINGK